MSNQPQFKNKDTQTHALGLAVSGSNYAYYFSTAGPNQAANSIWAGLTKNGKATVYSRPWHNTKMSSPGPGMKKAYQKVPNSSYGHIACRWTDPHLILVINQEGRSHLDHDSSDRQEWLQSIQPQVEDECATQLYHFVSKQTDAPLLPEWTTTLWHYALSHSGVTGLRTYGDCVAAHVISDSLQDKMTWTQLVAKMIKEKAVALDVESADQASPVDNRHGDTEYSESI